MKTILPLLLATVIPAMAEAIEPSHTLPIISVQTEQSRPIVDKITPIPAELTVQMPGEQPSDPIGLTIRGRGNSSWKYSSKKPYKLKFTDKQTFLDMPANRHFAALNYSDGYIGAIIAMESMSRLGAPWAPHIVPVELVLNGRYDGMYFIAETVRIGKNRLDIVSQADGETDPGVVPYGWLVEIDNYREAGQLIVREPGKSNIYLTPHSPETLSDQQRSWLQGEFNDVINSLYYGNNWTDKLDITSVARYFIVRELIHDTDAWRGSFYLWRDTGKWHFGPLWDAMLTTDAKHDWTINQHPSYATNPHLIVPIMEKREFWLEVGRLWEPFYRDVFPELLTLADQIAHTCSEADAANAARWGISNPPSAQHKALQAKTLLRGNAEWLDEQIAPFTDIREIETGTSADGDPKYFDLLGRRLTGPSRGIRIVRAPDGKARTINLR